MAIIEEWKVYSEGLYNGITDISSDIQINIHSAML